MAYCWLNRHAQVRRPMPWSRSAQCDWEVACGSLMQWLLAYRPKRTQTLKSCIVVVHVIIHRNRIRKRIRNSSIKIRIIFPRIAQESTSVVNVQPPPPFLKRHGRPEIPWTAEVGHNWHSKEVPVYWLSKRLHFCYTVSVTRSAAYIMQERLRNQLQRPM